MENLITIPLDNEDARHAVKVLAAHWEIDDDVAYFTFGRWLTRIAAELVTDALWFSDHEPAGEAWREEMAKAQRQKAEQTGPWTPPPAIDLEYTLTRLRNGYCVAVEQKHLGTLAAALVEAARYETFYLVHGPVAGGPVSYAVMLVGPDVVDSYRDQEWRFDTVGDLAQLHAAGLEADDHPYELAETCRTPGCGNSLDDGEGWDGFCGTCADRLEADEQPPDMLDLPGPQARRACPNCGGTDIDWTSHPPRCLFCDPVVNREELRRLFELPPSQPQPVAPSSPFCTICTSPALPGHTLCGLCASGVVML